jgi:hypothetical protein
MKSSVGAHSCVPLHIFITRRLACCLRAAMGLVVLTMMVSGCIFSGGVTTFNTKKYNGGVGYFSASERNGQWEINGPPPKVGDVTSRPLYRQLRKEAMYSILSASQDYGLSDPYPERQRRVTAIRELGTVSESGSTRHYYEVEFEFVEGN